ncbi:STAS domain-containing protein [Paractinoplanes ferrugineus]|nr:STAS domain-containing protein [Actinoplanes ferrugineus]
MESSIQRSRVAGTATVTVHGEIDYANCDELSQCLRDAITEWSPGTLRVELRAATFIDSTGLGALLEGYKAAGETGTIFKVVNPTAHFRRVLDVTGLTELFGLDVTGMAEESESTQATGA